MDNKIYLQLTDEEMFIKNLENTLNYSQAHMYMGFDGSKMSATAEVATLYSKLLAQIEDMQVTVNEIKDKCFKENK